ncbi:MAG TPA: 50S ribosomal protein L18 [Chloroflexota bacterium]|nr:50S ribosomal protein L18 [Chloroflexota bacterium]
MFKPANARAARRRRHLRVRRRLNGTTARPRLSVFRSASHIYAQIIDDTQGRTLVSASTLDSALRGGAGAKAERARAVGLALAQRAKAAGVTRVVFDRGGYLYHGRIKALADGAREGGLEF